MVRRWRTFGPQLDQVTENLRRGLADGRVAVRTPVAKVIQALDVALQVPDAESPFLAPLREAHDDWSESDRATVRGPASRDAPRAQIRPALARYRTFLLDEVLPRARPDETPGLLALPGGAAAYRTLVRYHTTLDWTPETLHRDRAGRSRPDQRGDGGPRAASPWRGEPGGDAPPAAGRPGDALPRPGAKSPEPHATALARAQAATPSWFGRLPVTPCVVVPISAHEEEHTTIAYYREPAADGSRPGQYHINTSHPETRPRYEAECLAYHEAVPGHHLQIALAQELTDLPEFRRHLGATAFVEGWGLYTERLSDEMGLYTGDLDRIGMLSMDAWRACRLVVDTGMHALGWTRQQAIDFMIANSALAPNNIANEVDRYIVWPGQALAYKTGQLEILRLRDEAERRSAGRFDIRAFHDAVLGNGAISLATLGAVVRGVDRGTDGPDGAGPRRTRSGLPAHFGSRAGARLAAPALAPHPTHRAGVLAGLAVVALAGTAILVRPGGRPGGSPTASAPAGSGLSRIFRRVRLGSDRTRDRAAMPPPGPRRRTSPSPR